MSILVLGSHSYQLVPDVNGDPLTVSAGGLVPSVTSGAGVPSGVPTYGDGTLYVDTTNYILYIYKSAVWTQVGTPLPTNLIYVLDKTTINSAVTGTGPSNTYSYTVPGGTLGTDKILKLQAQGYWQNTGGTRNVTIAVSYGGTTLWSDTSPSLASSANTGWSIELALAANNSATSQTLNGRIMIGGTGASLTGLTGDLATDEIMSNTILTGVTSSVNSAVNQSLNVTVTFSSSGSTWTKYYHVLELV